MPIEPRTLDDIEIHRRLISTILILETEDGKLTEYKVPFNFSDDDGTPFVQLDLGEHVVGVHPAPPNTYAAFAYLPGYPSCFKDDPENQFILIGYEINDGLVPEKTANEWRQEFIVKNAVNLVDEGFTFSDYPEDKP